MKVYWKNHPKGLNLILQTDEMEEVTFSHIGYSEITMRASEIRKRFSRVFLSL